MKKIFLLIMVLGLFQSLHSTSHDGYPATYWKVQNHCVPHVLFVIENEEGHTELFKILKTGELYTQPMERARTMWEARKLTFRAFQLDDANNIIKSLDYYYGEEWLGLKGGVAIHIPFFYYNPSLDQTGCLQAKKNSLTRVFVK